MWRVIGGPVRRAHRASEVLGVVRPGRQPARRAALGFLLVAVSTVRRCYSQHTNDWIEMLISTGPVQVLFRGTYSNAGDSDPIAYRSGTLVEFVKLMDLETGGIFDWTLGEHVDGDVAPGHTLTLTAEQSAEVTVGHSRSGREYTTTKYKHRIVACAPATADQAARNGRDKASA
jgi:hypothetical protein